MKTTKNAAEERAHLWREVAMGGHDKRFAAVMTLTKVGNDEDRAIINASLLTELARRGEHEALAEALQNIASRGAAGRPSGTKGKVH